MNTNNNPEQFNTWNDILSFHNMTQEQFDKWCEGLRPHEVGTRECEMIVAAYNGRQLDDPLPKWGPNTGWKYFGWYNMPNEASGAGFSLDYHGFGGTDSSVGARLVFFGEHASENFYDANKKFISSYEKMMTL